MLSRVFFSSKIVFIGFKCHEIDHITFSDYAIFFVLTLMVYHTWLTSPTGVTPSFRGLQFNDDGVVLFFLYKNQ